MKRFGTFVFLGLFLATPVWAEVRFTDFQSLVVHSYATQAESGTDLKIDEILALERRIGGPDPAAEGDEWARIKYLLSHWREETRAYLVQRAAGPHSEAALDALERLGALIPQADVEKLAAMMTWVSEEKAKQIAYVIAQNGEPESARAALRGYPQFQRFTDPATQVKMGPIDPSFYRYGLGWLKDAWEKDYEWSEDGKSVKIRGQWVQAGDSLLVDLAMPFDGINTSFAEPRTNFTHNAVVVFLEYGGRKIPAVFEIHSVGLRIVPLARYLSPEFVYYAEVYRPKKPPADPTVLGKKLSDLTFRLLEEQMHYDFDARPIPPEGYDKMVNEGQHCVVCSTLADTLYKTLQMGIAIPSSRVHPGARQSVANVGLDALADRGTYLTPTDIKLSDAMVRVGTVDNGLIDTKDEANLRREWLMGNPNVPGSFGSYMATGRLAPDRLPLLKGGAIYHTVKHVATFAQSNTWASRRFLDLTDVTVGMNARTQNQADPRALGTIVAFNTQLKAAHRGMDCRAALVGLAGKPFDLRESEARPVVRKAVDEALHRAGIPYAFPK